MVTCMDINNLKLDGMELVAVVMGCPEPKLRFKEVMKLLDYGYANYMLLKGEPAGKIAAEIPVIGGVCDSVNAVVSENVSYLTQKGNAKLDYKTELPEKVKAPVNEGDELGVMIYTCDEKEVGRSKLVADKTVVTNLYPTTQIRFNISSKKRTNTCIMGDKCYVRRNGTVLTNFYQIGF